VLSDRNPEETEAQLRQALAIYRANGVGGRAVARAASPLTTILQRQGKWNDLKAIANQAIAEVHKTPGAEYPEIASIEHGLVAAELAEGDYPQAERLAREALAIHLRLDGPGSIEMGWGYNVLGSALLAEKKLHEAMEAQKQALMIFSRALPGNSGMIVFPLAALKDIFIAAQSSSTLMELFPTVQNITDLEPLLSPSLAVKPRRPGSGPPTAAARCLTTLVGSYFALSRELTAAGRIEDARESQRRGVALLASLQAKVAANDDLIPEVYSGLMNTLIGVGEDQRANDVNAKLVALKRVKVPATLPAATP
jgi:tetratricopeptide (TPR) repeat protein